MVPALAAGFGTGLSLIVAIGAQNTFVLQQGLRGGAVKRLIVVCALSDVVLIAVGVSGIGAVLQRWPAAITAIGVVGGAFLVTYGFLAARRCMKPGALTTSALEPVSPRRTVLTGLALTWLNPHVYLDTVLLLGSVAAGQGGGRWVFGVGAALASAVWFSALGLGARRLAGVFARPAAWRILDGLIAVTMTALGVSMVLSRLA
ncbi:MULTISPECIES: LysE/ArgO family amino acid transporter [unclassified Amycolatopsis]|uniref:LysE/ArgO family amino acid transporter n=1 Tax=unclassified Amycolatopsis TaxID=2618356 RepID=UPI001C6972D6|nr:LysE/ArgO family amino acid transporter [Amycolatopsis sp. DSM 110486]QYN17907.1 LysE/ArgO family amino acid transporter [Amycolatopsis sp. DSM 110486]